MLGDAGRLQATGEPTRERLMFSQYMLHGNGDKKPIYLETQFQ